jgi:hypothetical protein
VWHRCSTEPTQPSSGASEYTRLTTPPSLHNQPNDANGRRPNSLERLTQTAHALSDATNRECLPLQADVRSPEALRAAVAATLARFGRIDFVICGKLMFPFLVLFVMIISDVRCVCGAT